MESNVVLQAIEMIARGLAFLGALGISVAFLYATVRGFLHIRQRTPEAYEHVKTNLGRALQLGLEFLVAADIIRTVLIKPTMDGILLLGLLIVVRRFLSWSITVEIEGCWPWQVARLGEKS
jgi:uncharacterized membrane protein